MLCIESKGFIVGIISSRLRTLQIMSTKHSI